jgi:hypothetical protein
LQFLGCASGYEQFRNLATGSRVRTLNAQRLIAQALLKAPDLVILDEGKEAALELRFLHTHSLLFIRSQVIALRTKRLRSHK